MLSHMLGTRIFRTIQSYFRSSDILLLFSICSLLVLSAVNMGGILGVSSPLFKKHLVVIGIGIGFYIFTSLFNYRLLKNYSRFVMACYLAAVLLLASSLLFPAIRGIHAWIIIGNFTLEPSEIMKLMLIIVLAKYFSQRHVHIYHYSHMVVSGIYFGIPALIILAQPDLGSAGIVFLIWFGMLMAAGINKKQFFLLAVLVAVVAYAGWMFALKPYQKDRIMAFINPYRDPTGIGYNIIQSQIAIGSGGWIGNGWGEGSQATLGFLPEAQNDFAFASLVEQFGAVGVLVLFGLISILISRVLIIGQNTENNFAKLFSIGLAIFFFAHVFVSAAVNIGLMPITGLPFSFLSYGGSHLFALMAGFGIMQNIHREG